MGSLFNEGKLQRFTTVESTNEILKKSLSTGVKEGTVVSALEQTSGRGQFGRNWQSDFGQNLLLSLLLKPVFLLPEQSFLLNMSVCLALKDVVDHISDNIRIKWPNDLLHKTDKLAGILIENQLSGQRWESAVVGIGLNVNQLEFHYPKTSSIRLISGEAQKLARWQSALLQALESRYLALQTMQDFTELSKEYQEALYGYHQPVMAEVEGRAVKVQIKTVAQNGLVALRGAGHAGRWYRYDQLRFKR